MNVDTKVCAIIGGSCLLATVIFYVLFRLGIG